MRRRNLPGARVPTAPKIAVNKPPIVRRCDDAIGPESCGNAVNVASIRPREAGTTTASASIDPPAPGLCDADGTQKYSGTIPILSANPVLSTATTNASVTRPPGLTFWTSASANPATRVIAPMLAMVRYAVPATPPCQSPRSVAISIATRSTAK